jgi:alcohol dehydrogenase class IV
MERNGQEQKCSSCDCKISHNLNEYQFCSYCSLLNIQKASDDHTSINNPNILSMEEIEELFNKSIPYIVGL